ncbi:2432_t:CDS:1 [Ambispora gerdemannii]|uniref:2432_t:CDS:1 n=1 Tax=Ambispora gerdemannii TaxID=144530 RepID=A0A9N9B2P5_9GLOM|nr:2432_t:CDS:1 [Ambispora gerdemannii]
MSHVNSKTLVYDTLKTLGRSTKVLPTNQERSTDFFTPDYEEEDEIYAPESFSDFFGDFIIEEDIEQAIKRLQAETEAARAMIDDSSSSGSSDDEDRKITKVTKKKGDANPIILKVFKKMLKLS